MDEDKLESLLDPENPKDPASSPEDKPTGVADENVIKTEEELEFSKLSGSTQDRIRELIRERNDARSKLNTNPQNPVNPNPNLNPAIDPNDPQIKAALTTLEAAGMSTQDFVKNEINKGIGGVRAEMRLNNLEMRYQGQEGAPKFDRTEVIDYMARHPQFQYYDFEDVFKYKMYPEEFQSMGRTNGGENTTNPIRPTKATTVTPEWTPEKLEARLQQPDGPAWYDKNFDKIQTLMDSWKPETPGY